MRSPLISILAAALMYGAGHSAQAIEKGDVFPELTARQVRGPVASLKGKITLVDFWASWCGPCKLSFPAMQELYRQYGPRGFQVIAVSVNEEADDLSAFLEDQLTSFAILHDTEHKDVERAQVETMPTSFLLDAAGRVIAVHNGFAGASTEKELAAEIEQALNRSVKK